MNKAKKPLKEMVTGIKNGCKQMARFFREEDLLKTIAQSFRLHLSKSEKLFAYFFLVGALVMPMLSAIINAFGENYVTIHPWMLDGLLPGCAFCLFLCLKMR